MKLREVFNTLASGELANLPFVDESTGLIKEAYYAKLVSSINLAVTDLHTRFVLKMGTMYVDLIPGQNVYKLVATNQVGSRARLGTEQFITQDSTKLRKDLLKILEVHAMPHEGYPYEYPLGLNNHDPQRGVFTTTYDTLNVVAPLQDKYKVKQLKVVYQMNGNPVCNCDDDDIDPDVVDVDIDYSHLWALCLFVASRVHNPSGFGTGGVHEGNNYWAKYQDECRRLEHDNMRLDYTAENIGRLRKGFP